MSTTTDEIDQAPIIADVSSIAPPARVTAISLSCVDVSMGVTMHRDYKFHKTDYSVIELVRASVARPGAEGSGGNMAKATFSSPVMSRRHAKIEIPEDGSAYITDLDSLHGTSVQRCASTPERLKPQSRYKLNTDDIIILGKTVYRDDKYWRPASVRVTLLHEEKPSTYTTENTEATLTKTVDTTHFDGPNRFGMYSSGSSSIYATDESLDSPDEDIPSLSPQQSDDSASSSPPAISTNMSKFYSMLPFDLGRFSGSPALSLPSIRDLGFFNNSRESNGNTIPRANAYSAFNSFNGILHPSADQINSLTHPFYSIPGDLLGAENPVFPVPQRASSDTNLSVRSNSMESDRDLSRSSSPMEISSEYAGPTREGPDIIEISSGDCSQNHTGTGVDTLHPLCGRDGQPMSIGHESSNIQSHTESLNTHNVRNTSETPEVCEISREAYFSSVVTPQEEQRKHAGGPVYSLMHNKLPPIINVDDESEIVADTKYSQELQSEPGVRTSPTRGDSGAAGQLSFASILTRSQSFASSEIQNVKSRLKGLTDSVGSMRPLLEQRLSAASSSSSAVQPMNSLNAVLPPIAESLPRGTESKELQDIREEILRFSAIMEQVLTKIEPLRTQSEQAIQVDAQSVRASPLVEHEENMPSSSTSKKRKHAEIDSDASPLTIDITERPTKRARSMTTSVASAIGYTSLGAVLTWLALAYVL